MSSSNESETSFDEVPRLHGDELYRCAMQLTGERSAALDLVQDTYERALRRGLAGVPRENVRGWLIVIARNQFIDDYRARKRTLITSDRRILETAVAPEPDHDEPSPWSHLRAEDVHRILARQNPLLVVVYRMRTFEGMGYATIAHRLGIPISTVGTRLRRARLQLRRALLAERAASLLPIPLSQARRAPARVGPLGRPEDGRPSADGGSNAPPRTMTRRPPPHRSSWIAEQRITSVR
jgi:RNA polymerase sigma factor (sigma-70 family)